MAEKNKKKQSKALPLWVIFLPLIDLVLIIRYLIHGKNIALFNPKGYIAHQQHNLMVFTICVFLIVAIPTIFIGYFMAWRFRDTNTKAKHDPNNRVKKPVVFIIWAVPIATLCIMSTVMWSASHKLYPQKTISSNAKPLTIQVISLRWKWVFIYPEQKVATVNFVQLPLNTPVTFEMTADETPMSSFWIPNLGGQLYTMTSHVNRLNLMATTAGDYPGSSAEINGAGFAGMKFTARAGTTAEFDKWVQSVKQSPDELDAAKYEKLLIPSQYVPAKFYASFDPNIYADVLLKYDGHEGHSH